jgi:hypothetical protein
VDSTFRLNRRWDCVSQGRADQSVETIERDFKHKVCEELRVASEGINRYRVFTPFMFNDGDHLSIVLKRENQQWMLSDESYYRKLWNRCRDEKGGVPFRVDHANPGGSRVEGDATDAEGNGQWGWKGSRRATF